MISRQIFATIIALYGTKPDAIGDEHYNWENVAPWPEGRADESQPLEKAPPKTRTRSAAKTPAAKKPAAKTSAQDRATDEAYPDDPLPDALPSRLTLPAKKGGKVDWTQTYTKWHKKLKSDWDTLEQHRHGEGQKLPWKCDETFLSDENVHHCIESVWATLHLDPKPSMRWMKGTSILDQFGRGSFNPLETQLMRPMGARSQKIIIPMTGNYRERSFNHVTDPGDHGGHHVCVLAERLGDGSPDLKGENAVDLTLFDSVGEGLYQDQVFAHARNMAQNSGWLGAQPDPTTQKLVPVHVRIRVRQQHRPVTPRQTGVEQCGLYVVLNAWATMLDIPIHNDVTRRGKTHDKTFIQDAHFLVNAAAAGLVHLRFIEAFFIKYGYAADGHGRNGPTVPDYATSDKPKRRRAIEHVVDPINLVS